MILCIAEKQAMAADIARILGAGDRRQGYFEGNGYCVSWTIGHLCTLKEPADYTETWKRWSLGALPMIPPRFGIKLIDKENIKRQFKVIETLAANATEIINCGDAGQEGELIQRWVMQLAGVKCPVKRLWISSLTDQSIREGFRNLKPDSDYDRLYHAGLCRAIGDWVLGMNATRLYSLKYSSPGKVLSVGRVQTPTLAMIVKRHAEIVNFKPKDYWELATVYRDVRFSAKGQFDAPEKVEQLVQRLSPLPFTVEDVVKKRLKESAPRLFDLTSLQVECNRRWGWSASETLRLIQSLYEKKVTTYPRVDTTYLPDDVYPQVGDILRHMTPYAPQTAPLLERKIPKSKKIFDNSKVTDHHAIIPTGEHPGKLVGDERKLYHLIALRFIGVFYPDCQYDQTVVTGRVDDVEFKASGKVVAVPGWRVLIQDTDTPDSNDEDNESRLMPPFEKGESGPHSPQIIKKTTQPPKYYTEGTLLRAMETAGKTVDDETLREALKENGIGRPSTRDAIIETLFRRRYIERRRKSIIPTNAGIELIETIKEDMLKSASLTGVWENRLRQIEKGNYDAADFIAKLKEMICGIVLDVLHDNSSRHIEVGDQTEKDQNTSEKNPSRKKKKSSTNKITSYDQIKCPVCKKGHIIKGRTAFGCSRFAEGCALRLNFGEYSDSLSPQQLAERLKGYKP